MARMSIAKMTIMQKQLAESVMLDEFYQLSRKAKHEKKK